MRRSASYCSSVSWMLSRLMHILLSQPHTSPPGRPSRAADVWAYCPGQPGIAGQGAGSARGHVCAPHGARLFTRDTSGLPPRRSPPPTRGGKHSPHGGELGRDWQCHTLALHRTDAQARDIRNNLQAARNALGIESNLPSVRRRRYKAPHCNRPLVCPRSKHSIMASWCQAAFYLRLRKNLCTCKKPGPRRNRAYISLGSFARRLHAGKCARVIKRSAHIV